MCGQTGTFPSYKQISRSTHAENDAVTSAWKAPVWLFRPGAVVSHSHLFFHFCSETFIDGPQTGKLSRHLRASVSESSHSNRAPKNSALNLVGNFLLMKNLCFIYKWISLNATPATRAPSHETLTTTLYVLNTFVYNTVVQINFGNLTSYSIWQSVNFKFWYILQRHALEKMIKLNCV